MYQLYSEIFVFFTYFFLIILLQFLNENTKNTKLNVARMFQSVAQFMIYVAQPLFYLHGDENFRKNCMNQGMWHALKKEIFRPAWNKHSKIKRNWDCEYKKFLWIVSTIWMSYWCHTMVDGAEFCIRCQWLVFLSILSCWQLIQNSAPSTIVWHQCDIRIVF